MASLKEEKEKREQVQQARKMSMRMNMRMRKERAEREGIWHFASCARSGPEAESCLTTASLKLLTFKTSWARINSSSHCTNVSAIH